MRTLPIADLQRVVDYVAQQVKPTLGTLTNDDEKNVDVTFTSGIVLKYPSWMLTKRGHDLLSIYQSVFGQMVITPPKLEKSFRRVRLVPMELAEIMSQLQET